MYAAIAKNAEPINGIKAGTGVVVFVSCPDITNTTSSRATTPPKDPAISRRNARNRVKGRITTIDGHRTPTLRPRPTFPAVGALCPSTRIRSRVPGSDGTRDAGDGEVTIARHLRERLKRRAEAIFSRGGGWLKMRDERHERRYRNAAQKVVALSLIGPLKVQKESGIMLNKRRADGRSGGRPTSGPPRKRVSPSVVKSGARTLSPRPT